MQLISPQFGWNIQNGIEENVESFIPAFSFLQKKKIKKNLPNKGVAHRGVHVDICSVICDIQTCICKIRILLLNIRISIWIIFFYPHGYCGYNPLFANR
jgi:hypothetical protein